MIVTAAQLREAVTEECPKRTEYLALIDQKEEYTITEILDALPGILEEFYGERDFWKKIDFAHFAFSVVFDCDHDRYEAFRDRTRWAHLNEAIEILKEYAP